MGKKYDLGQLTEIISQLQEWGPLGNKHLSNTTRCRVYPNPPAPPRFNIENVLSPSCDFFSTEMPAAAEPRMQCNIKSEGVRGGVLQEVASGRFFTLLRNFLRQQ